MTATPAPATFNGFHAKFKGDDGEIFIAKVINKGVGKSGKDMLKIRKKVYAGFKGWPGGCTPVYSYASPIWIWASRQVTA